MGGRTKPLTCCDRDCAEANGCRIGGGQCRKCGRWFCPPLSLDESGLCDECAVENEDCEEMENEGQD